MSTQFNLSLVVICLAVAAVVSQLSYRLSPEPPPPIRKEDTWVLCPRVLEVYDGDTIACDFDNNGKVSNQLEHVRMLGINATEMHWSRKNKTGQDEPYAKAAMDFVEHSVQNKPIYLERDAQYTDKYGRTLAYVYLDANNNIMLNKLLLERGLAKVLFMGKNRRYEAEFETLQQQAQQQRVGLWGNTAMNES